MLLEYNFKYQLQGFFRKKESKNKTLTHKTKWGKNVKGAFPSSPKKGV